MGGKGIIRGFTRQEMAGVIAPSRLRLRAGVMARFSFESIIAPSEFNPQKRYHRNASLLLLIIGAKTNMQTETSNFWLVLIAGFGVLLGLINIAVLILALRAAKRYTEKNENTQLALTKRFDQTVFGEDLSPKIYEAAQRQIERMTQQADISTKIYEVAQRQTEELVRLRKLSILPTFAARLQPDQSGTPIHHLYLKNIGVGIAINVEIARIDFITPPNADPSATTETIDRVPEKKNGYSVFQPIQSLSPNNEQMVKSFNHPADPDRVGEVIRQYGYTGLDYLSFIDEDTPLHIDFQDIEGNRYHQVITRKGGIFAPSPVKPVDEE
jgi:hypothetical protein